jgi:hypothetical protein
VPSDIAERSGQVVAGYTGDVRNFLERDLARKMTFNEPEGLADGIHRRPYLLVASLHILPVVCLMVIALGRKSVGFL